MSTLSDVASLLRKLCEIAARTGGIIYAIRFRKDMLYSQVDLIRCNNEECQSSQFQMWTDGYVQCALCGEKLCKK